jgi:hypothetical protein
LLLQRFLCLGDEPRVLDRNGTPKIKPEGETRFAVCVTIPPACLDPGQTGPGFLVTVKG